MLYYILFSFLVGFGITIMEDDESYPKLKKLPKIVRFLIFILVIAINATAWPIYFGMAITMIKELNSEKW